MPWYLEAVRVCAFSTLTGFHRLDRFFPREGGRGGYLFDSARYIKSQERGKSKGMSAVLGMVMVALNGSLRSRNFRLRLGWGGIGTVVLRLFLYVSPVRQ